MSSRILMVLLPLALAGCVSVKRAPEPDMSRLIPINTEMPAELVQRGTGATIRNDIPHINPGDPQPTFANDEDE